MTTKNVTVVRVYIMESSDLLSKIVHYLKDEANIRGYSVFRAISGFGETGNHSSSLLDLSLNLPLVVEFFENDIKAKAAISFMSTIVKPEHILYWTAKTNA
jgi:PII-like signaling protein